MMYCTTAVPATLIPALVRLNEDETRPAFIGYKSTNKMVMIEMGPERPMPARNKITSSAARLTPESKTQPHIAVVTKASIVHDHMRSSIALSMGNRLNSSPLLRSADTLVTFATRA